MQSKCLHILLKRNTGIQKWHKTSPTKETDAILEVLKADMSPEEIKRIDTIKKNGKHAWGNERK